MRYNAKVNLGEPNVLHKALLRFFGRAEIWLEGQQLELGQRKTLALLAFVALEGLVSRNKLMMVFWADHDEETARRNLRRELHRLREAGLRDVLQTPEDQVCLQHGLNTDVQLFEAAVKNGNLETALELYRGELLSELRVEPMPMFDAWLEQWRGRLSEQRKHLQLELAECFQTKGDWTRALELHQAVLQIDPLQEAQHREVMRLQHLLGQREAALRQFEQCKRILHTELGLEPLPITLQLAQQIRLAQRSSPLESAESAQVLVAPTWVAPFVGRTVALAMLEGSLTPLTLVLGEAGIGKTRLLEVFAPQALRVQFKAVSSQTPFYAIAESLRQALNNPEIRERFDTLEAIWQLEAARLMPELLPKSPKRPAQERRVFLEGLTQVVLCCVTNIIIFEDIHWADDSSLELLAHLSRRVMGEPDAWRIVATARPEELSHQTQDLLEILRQDQLLTNFPLEPLSLLEVQQLANSINANADLAQNLFTATAGNSFYICETLRHWLENNADTGIAPSVRRAVLQRVEKLGKATQRLLETAALSQDGFCLEDIQPATALSEWESLEGLEQAVQAHIVIARESGYGFVHEITRAALQSTLSLERQRLIHSKLAVSLEQTNADAARIAGHLEQSGNAQKAVPWRIQAAKQAEQVYAHNQALEQYRMAMQFANRKDLFTLYQDQVRVMTALGLSQERSVVLEEMNRLALEFQNLQWQVLAQLHLAQHLNQTRQYRLAISTIDTLLAQHNLSSQDLAWAWLERGIGWFRLGELSTGKHDLSDALKHEDLLEPSTHAEIHSCLRVIALYEGEVAVAEYHVAREMEIAVRFGSVSGKLGATTGMARIAMIKGEVLRATRMLQESLALAMQIGRVGEQLYAQMWLSYNQIRLGQWVEAEINIQHAMTLAVQSDDKLTLVRLLLMQARLQNIQGQLGTALDSAQHALKLAKTVSAVAEIIALRRLATLLLDLGDTQQAQQHFQLALQHAQHVQSKAYYCSLETGLLRCAIKCKDRHASQTHLANALEFKSLAEHNEQTDLRFVQVKYLLWSGNINEAKVLLEPLRSSKFPEDQWRFWKFELQRQIISKTSGDVVQALQLVQSSPANPSTLKLRYVLLKILENTSAKKYQYFQRATKKLMLEMTDSLIGYPDLQTAFGELFID